MQDERFGHGQDSDYEIDPEAEASLHFGGGFEKKAIAAESSPEEPRRKSKKEVSVSFSAPQLPERCVHVLILYVDAVLQCQASTS